MPTAEARISRDIGAFDGNILSFTYNLQLGLDMKDGKNISYQPTMMNGYFNQAFYRSSMTYWNNALL